MSTESITVLQEEAMAILDSEYFLNTPMEMILSQAIGSNDYETLRHYLKMARDIMFDLEYDPGEVKDQRDEVGDIY